MKERRIIANREGASMASTWTEYLCVRNIGEGNGIIEICGYEALGEIKFDENEDDVSPLPTEIGGKIVRGIEDGYIIVGGDLMCIDDCETFVLHKTNLIVALEWIKSRHFHTTSKLLEELERALKE